MTSNYLIATWSGKRRNPSSDYLKAQFRQLRKVSHNLTEITIIIPTGSNDPDYYDVPTEYANTWLNRPYNDRSYGQFLFACREMPWSDYYFLVEDDYLPVRDDFDSMLIDLLNVKGADYLCGSFGPVPGGSVSVPRHNIGVIRGDALRRIADLHPIFFPNGENDGQEQEIFGRACHAAGVKIADWSDVFAVPYYDRYLRYFSDRRDNPVFAPYQLIEKKAFGYHGEEGDESSHFLSTMEFDWDDKIHCTVRDNQIVVGKFRMEQGESEVSVLIDATYPKEYDRLICDRIYYECRGRTVTIRRA